MYSYSDQDDRYLFSFMLLVSVFIVYGVYKHNPNFMNRKPLAESLSESQSQSFTIPKNIPSVDSLGPWNFIEGRNISTTHILDPEVMLANNYVRETLKPLPSSEGIQNKFIGWSPGETGIYSAFENEIIKSNLNGEILWKFQVQTNDKISTLPIEGSQYLFFSTKNGLIYKIDRVTGHLIWLIQSHGKIINNFLPYNSYLFYITSEENNLFYLKKLNGNSGEVLWSTRLVGFESPSPLTINEDHKLIMFTDPNGSLLTLDLNNGHAYWQAKKLGEVKSPPSTNGETIYVVNQTGTATALNIKKKSISWEYQLHSGSHGSFAYIPSYGLVAILTDTGYLHAIEARTGEGHWKYNTNNSHPSRDIFSVRLDKKSINKYKLNWNHKGWSLFAPCSIDYLCVFNPENGQMMNRIKLYGKIDARRGIDIIENKIVILLNNPENLPWKKSDSPLPELAFSTYKVYSPNSAPSNSNNVDP